MEKKIQDNNSSLKKESGRAYILDTNVLLHDPRALFTFSGAEVIIPLMVVEELEKFKRETSDRGKNSRECIRELDKLRQQGSLSDGIAMEGGGNVRIALAAQNIVIPPSFRQDVPDDQIILIAYALKLAGKPVRFISKDLAARIKADVLGIESEDYLKGYIPRDEFYKGWYRMQVPSVQLKHETPEDLIEYSKEYQFLPNEYVLVEAQHADYNNKVYCYDAAQKKFRTVVHPSIPWNLKARNPQQLMALDALCNPAVEFVTLLGPAGTGKTFLALLAGLAQVVVQHQYKKMLVSRPVVPLGPDIGYLPGDIKEKLHSWMQPVYDNIEVILYAAAAQEHLEKVKNEETQDAQQLLQRSNRDKDYFDKKKRKNHEHDSNRSHSHRSFTSVDDLIRMGRLSLEAITYMRGRSIPYQFILIDEVQNLSPHEVKTIVSRVGQGSKIILCGDPYQIDSPYLDFSSNGLVVATDKFKGQEVFSTVFLESSERGKLSELAGKLL